MPVVVVHGRARASRSWRRPRRPTRRRSCGRPSRTTTRCCSSSTSGSTRSRARWTAQHGAARRGGRRPRRPRRHDRLRDARRAREPGRRGDARRLRHRRGGGRPADAPAARQADTILASLAKTNRLVVVEEGPLTGGWAGEVLALVTEEGLGDLDDAWRIATPDSPIPYSPPLEDAHLPGAERIAAEIARRGRDDATSTYVAASPSPQPSSPSDPSRRTSGPRLRAQREQLGLSLRELGPPHRRLRQPDLADRARQGEPEREHALLARAASSADMGDLFAGTAPSPLDAAVPTAATATPLVTADQRAGDQPRVGRDLGAARRRRATRASSSSASSTTRAASRAPRTRSSARRQGVRVRDRRPPRRPGRLRARTSSAPATRSRSTRPRLTGCGRSETSRSRRSGSSSAGRATAASASRPGTSLSAGLP